MSAPVPSSGTPASAPGSAGGRRRLPRNVLVLGFVSFLTDVSSEMTVWTVPFFVALLGGGLAWIGLVEGVRESLASALKLASGWFSDRIGRRKALVVVGYGLSTLVKPFLALAAAPWHVLGLLGIERTGKGIRTAPRDALIAGDAPEERRAFAFSFQRAMDHAGAVVGLAVGAALAAWLFASYRDAAAAGADRTPADVFRTMFLVAAVPAALAVALVAFQVRENAGSLRRAAIGRPGGYDRRFRTFLLAVLVFTLGNSSDLLLLVRAAEILGFGLRFTESEQAAMAAGWSFPWQIPIMYLVLSLAKTAFSLPGGILADRIGRGRTLLAGWLVYAAVYVLFGLAGDAWQVWALLLAYGAFHGFTEGIEKALVADFAPAEARGGAFGLHALTEGLAKLPANLLLGLLYSSFGAAAAFGFGGLCAALACIPLVLALRTQA